MVHHSKTKLLQSLAIADVECDGLPRCSARKLMKLSYGLESGDRHLDGALARALGSGDFFHLLHHGLRIAAFAAGVSDQRGHVLDNDELAVPTPVNGDHAGCQRAVAEFAGRRLSSHAMLGIRDAPRGAAAWRVILAGVVLVIPVPSSSLFRMGYERGFDQRSPGNRLKSPSHEHSSAPCSTAIAARCASEVKLPPVPRGRRRVRSRAR